MVANPLDIFNQKLVEDADAFRMDREMAADRNAENIASRDEVRNKLVNLSLLIKEPLFLQLLKSVDILYSGIILGDGWGPIDILIGLRQLWLGLPTLSPSALQARISNFKADCQRFMIADYDFICGKDIWPPD